MGGKVDKFVSVSREYHCITDEATSKELRLYFNASRPQAGLPRSVANTSVAILTIIQTTSLSTATNFVTRSVLCYKNNKHFDDGYVRCCSEYIASGIALLCEILSDSKEVSSQGIARDAFLHNGLGVAMFPFTVFGLLQNNTSFLERVVSCVPDSSQPKVRQT